MTNTTCCYYRKSLAEHEARLNALVDAGQGQTVAATLLMNDVERLKAAVDELEEKPCH